MDRATAAAKVFPGALASLIPAWEGLDQILIAHHLARDVKTIYVSYTDQAKHLVAAVHPDHVTGTIEVALALPPDHPNPILHDAMHLKWRSLPLAIRLSKVEDVNTGVKDLIAEAVAHAPMSIPRPSEDFGKVKRRGRMGAS